jgi:hypothetical protein
MLDISGYVWLYLRIVICEGAYLPFSKRVLWVSTVETKKMKENLERKRKSVRPEPKRFCYKAPKEKGGGHRM